MEALGLSLVSKPLKSHLCKIIWTILFFYYLYVSCDLLNYLIIITESNQGSPSLYISAYPVLPGLAQFCSVISWIKFKRTSQHNPGLKPLETSLGGTKVQGHHHHLSSLLHETHGKPLKILIPPISSHPVQNNFPQNHLKAQA